MDLAVIASVLVTLGVAIIFFMALPGRQQVLLGQATAALDLRAKMVQSLRSAGLFDQSPSIVAMSLFAITAVVCLLLAMAVGYVGLALGPAFVFFGWRLYLMSRQRKHMARAHDELVPFFNRMATAVSGNVPVQRAYMQAVEESHTLKQILEPSAARVASGENFSKCLVETIELMPVRMWAVFVRQMELYEEVGGNLEQTMQSTVKQINKMLQLQAEARADYAIQARQQQIILVLLAAGFGGMAFIVPGGGAMFMTLLTSFAGLVGLLTGTFVIAFGLWFLNKQLRDVERKLNI